MLLVVLLCAVSLSPLAAATAPSPEPMAGASEVDSAHGQTLTDATGPTAWQVSAPANDTSTANDSTPVRHRDPRGLAEEGDLTDLERTLATVLATRLSQSSVAISEGEYARARSLLGDEYDTVLGRYVRVAGETPGSDGDTGRFSSTREEQSAFLTTVSTYRQKRAEYDAAKRAGDEGEARAVARELDALATEAEQRSDRLGREYETLGRASGQDFSSARESLERVRQDVSAEQQVIREAEFVETSLTVTGVGGGGSFVDPVAVFGTLVDERGEPIGNRTVVVAVNGTDYRTAVNASGTFSVSYRPVTDGLGERELTVEYVPQADSVYLGSRTTASAVIRQSTPTITLDDASRRAGFGETVAVSGTVSVERRPAAGVPLVVRVGNTTVGETASDDIGDFRFEGPLPAFTGRGDRQIRVAYPFEERALAPAEAAAPFFVDTTRTELTVDGTQAALESLAVSGRLTTADGRPVAGQSVTLLVAESETVVVNTSDTGGFEADVWLPATVAGGFDVDVVATFGGTGTNLAPSRASTSVPVVGLGTAASRGAAGSGESAGGGGSGGSASGPLGEALVGVVGPTAQAEVRGVSIARLAAHPWFDGAVVLVVALVGGVVALARRRGADAGTGGDDADPDAGPTAADGVGIDDAEVPGLLVDLARDRIRDGALRLGVEYAYLGARIGVAARTGVPNRGTHRRFAAGCVTALTSVDSARLTALTECYERALFGGRDLPAADAAAALVEARSLVDHDSGAAAAGRSKGAAVGTEADSPLARETGSHGD